MGEDKEEQIEAAPERNRIGSPATCEICGEVGELTALFLSIEEHGTESTIAARCADHIPEADYS